MLKEDFAASGKSHSINSLTYPLYKEYTTGEMFKRSNALLRDLSLEIRTLVINNDGEKQLFHGLINTVRLNFKNYQFVLRCD